MSRTRDLNCVAGVIVFAALVLGAQPGAAEPVRPAGDAEIAAPVTTTSTTTPPNPDPAVDLPADDLAAELPTTDPTDPTEPPEPADPGQPTQPAERDEPARPTAQRSQPRTLATPKKPAVLNGPSTNEAATIPTPTLVDTGLGTGPETPTWLFWVVPGIAVLVLGAGLTGWWLARSEQDRR